MEIDKDDGGKRPLGIPTVRDRVVQEALRRVIEPILEPHFHPSSYAYRPERSCHMAVAKAEAFINRYGLKHVVDMDLSKCFDRLDHELMLQAVNRRISNGRVLALIRQFLEAGVVADGSWEETEIGNPQGGVISSLLCNIYLDAFDQEMMAQGIRIVRYADDILIFARSPRQAERYRETATQILEEDLRLVVNRQKTHIADVYRSVPFLGFVIHAKCVSIHPKRIKRFKDRVRLRQSPSQYGSSEMLVRPTGSCRLDPV